MDDNEINPILSESTQGSVKNDIYDIYIFPYIDQSEKGDTILFSTPSTFFGYYSNGAKRFEEVCDALRKAKLRGVEIKLMIDIHDVFTAKAAEGLLSFLIDGREIRHCEGNTDYYAITLYNKNGKTKHASFVSDRPKVLSYLPGIQIRPYRGVKLSKENIHQQDADSIASEFFQFWERMAELAGGNIMKYSIIYHARKYYIALQIIVYFLVLTIGLIIGTAFSYGDKGLIAWLAASIGVGIIGSLLANFFSKKLGYS